MDDDPCAVCLLHLIELSCTRIESRVVPAKLEVFREERRSNGLECRECGEWYAEISLVGSHLALTATDSNLSIVDHILHGRTGIEREVSVNV